MKQEAKNFERVVYTKLSRRLLGTLEKHSTMTWSGGIAPSKLFPNLEGKRIFVFAWTKGIITWSHLGYFDKDDRYLKVKPDEFLRWCVGKFPREIENESRRQSHD
jgi:hypothetical protein